jgi:hypothetical protein
LLSERIGSLATEEEPDLRRHVYSLLLSLLNLSYDRFLRRISFSLYRKGSRSNSRLEHGYSISNLANTSGCKMPNTPISTSPLRPLFAEIEEGRTEARVSLRLEKAEVPSGMGVGSASRWAWGTGGWTVVGGGRKKMEAARSGKKVASEE